MENSTLDLIKNQFNSLPKDLKEAILNTDIGGIINSISKKHFLHIDQEGILQTEVLLVLLGLEDVDRFIDNINKAGIVDQESALLLAKEVHDQIFQPVIENLQKIQSEYRTHEDNQEVSLLGKHTSEASARKELLEAIESPLEQTKNSFVNAFLTKPVSTTQTTTTVTVGGGVTIPAGNLGQSAPIQQGLSPLSKPSSIEPPQNGTLNVVKKPIEAPKTYTVDPYKEPIN